MSLSTALSIAQSALMNTARQTSVVSRNVADASNPDYSRRQAVVTSTAPGARSVDIQRAANELLFRQNLGALSAWTAIANLQQALQLYATSPSNQNLGASVIDAAKQVVRSLNEGSKAVQDFRTQTDGQIATAVDDLNALLGQFQDANTAVMSGTRSGTDVSDALDQRDALLKKISNYVPVSTFTRGDNDMVITTGDGTTLFETI
ncbi:MAG: flagellar hook-associated protein FlgK, partial [Mesorhizobium sp.]